MNNKKIILPLFLLMVLAQLYVPTKMIIDSETTLQKGQAYKFKTIPVDPNDPFRGKFIVLRYEANRFEVPINKDFIEGQSVYVSLTNDADGYAQISAITPQAPLNTNDFVQAHISYILTHDTSKELTISYPFNRYYMEESKAYAAEKAYNEASRQPHNISYALVTIKDGQAVLQDVLINGISIVSIVDGKQ